MNKDGQGRPLRNRIWVLGKKMDHGYLKEEIQREETAGAKALRQRCLTCLRNSEVASMARKH